MPTRNAVLRLRTTGGDGKRPPGDTLTTVSRRSVLAGCLIMPIVTAPACLAQTGQAFRPEDYGAKGDGRTNDTRAFAAMSRAVMRAGGGTIQLSRKIYLVGEQRRGGPGQYGLEPLPIIELRNLRSGITIVGGGAVLRAQGGSRYGSFEHGTGPALQPAMPFNDLTAIATPYRAMISIENSIGPVRISNLELDGNIAQMVHGGQWGDTGRQLPMSGILLRDNGSDEQLSDIYSHDHGLDGMMIDGLDRETAATRRIASFRADGNGRQGCSVVGGHGYDFVDCMFSRTGRSGLASAPTAGVDIEAEGGKRITAVKFTRCRFVDNAGGGLLAEAGPSRDVLCQDCTFIGTTNWSCWPSKPGMVFTRCRFIGALANPYASDTAGEATVFDHCFFTDDPAQSPTGNVYLSRINGPIVDGGGTLEGSKNVLFRGCSFELVAGATLPWTWTAIFEDCNMSQRAAATGYPRGTYRGTNRIQGKVDLYSSHLNGPTIVNGAPIN